MSEYAEMQSLAARFADDHLEEVARRMDSADEFPHNTYRELANLGFLAITSPEEIGGVGADIVAWALVIEQLSRVCPQMADMILLAKEMSDFLLQHGAPKHREIASAIVRGDLICSIAITEPDAGSDVAAISTRAERVPNGYRLFGSKRFITAGSVANRAIVLARTDPAPGHRSLTALLVDTSSAGFAVARTEDLMGMRGMGTAELVFDSVFVPEEDRLGAEGDGFLCMMKTLDVGRIGIGAMCVGIAQGALEAAIAYAKQRVQFGRPISDFQGVQFLVADMDVCTEAARLLVMHAAERHARGEAVRLEAARAKLVASDAAVAVVSDALQIHGGVGYSKEMRIERLYRDAKINQIWEGTNQIMRSVIGRQLLRQ